MKLLLIGNTESYETGRIVEECKKRGHNMDILPLSKIIFDISNENITIIDDEIKNLLNYDTYIFRGINSDRGEAQVLARYLQSNNKIVIERKLGEGRYVMTKLPYTLCSNGINVVPTKLLWTPDTISKLDLKYPLIIRKTIGSKGQGILKVNNEKELKKAFYSLGNKVLLQPYYSINHDYRVIIIGGKVIGVMKKTKKDGSIVSNASAGGIVEKSELPKSILDMCIKASYYSRVDIAGVDVMQDDDGIYRILEVNSMPQFKAFEECTNLNVAKEIILFIEEVWYSTEEGKIEKDSKRIFFLDKSGKKWYPKSALDYESIKKDKKIKKLEVSCDGVYYTKLKNININCIVKLK